MKSLVTFLGCALMAFAIGCGDSESSKPLPPIADQTKAMSEMMKAQEKNAPADAAAGEKKEDAAAEKKEEAPAEKKEDAAAEKKEEAPAEKKDAEKKEEAGEKKEEKKE